MLFRSLALASSLALSRAHDHDAFHIHNHQQQPLTVDEAAKRVAVIGAGAAGASTAHHLRKFADAAGIKTNITVFERNSYIGGRSTTVQAYDDPTSEPLELGASIFVNVNYVLMNATEEFGLRTDDFSASTTPEFAEEHAQDKAKAAEAPLLGIWDGARFVLTQSATDGWWDNAKLLWRYGLAPIRTNNLMKKTVQSFLKLYEEPLFPFKSLSDATYELGLTAVTAVTGEQYLRENQIGDLFAREVVQAATRVNYAQNLGLIHGLEAMVVMATDGAVGVEGGNWQIFQRMVDSATEDVRMGTKVSALQKLEDGRYAIESKHVNPEIEQPEIRREHFDSVVLATPLQFSNIDLIPEPMHVPSKIPYVKLHVTLFTSPHPLSPAAFNLPPDGLVPEIIITTLQEDEKPGSNPNGVGRAGFFSISLLQRLVNRNVKPLREEFAYKIFTPMEVNAEFLAKILGLEPLPTDKSDCKAGSSLDVSKDDVSWIYRKVWDSYPYEYPRVTFEELRLDQDLWYTSGIESFISTMETSALMGKNVARLIVDDWMHGKEDTHQPQPLERKGKPLKAKL